MTDDNLAWEIMRDHYRTLYFCSPGFRETVNWSSKTLTEMIHGDNGWWQWDRRYTPKKEAFVRKQHEEGVKALEIALDSIVRENPALAAERRYEGAEPVPSKLSIEEQRFKRMLLQDMISLKEAVRLDWYRKNQLQLEGKV